MAVKNNQRTIITKMLLKQSLIELMHKKSINSISIKEICEKAELNRSTFYLHYTDQIDLLSDIENEIIEQTKDYLQDSHLKSDTYLYIKTFLEYIKSNEDIFRTLLCQKDNISFQTIFITKMLDHIKESIPFSGPAEIKKYVYCYVMQGSVHIIQEWINSDFDISSDVLADTILTLCKKVTD